MSHNNIITDISFVWLIKWKNSDSTQATPFTQVCTFLSITKKQKLYEYYYEFVAVFK